MKCKYCKYFGFERDIQVNLNRPVLTLGVCNFDGRDFGNKTTSISESCKNFVSHGHKYQVCDVLINKSKALFIKDIQEDYYPRQYRVIDNKLSTYSMSEEELDKEGFTLLNGGREMEATDVSRNNTDAWHRTSHKLPVPDKSVLVYVSSNKCNYTAYYDDGKWYHFGSRNTQIPVVDFWRELPPNPDEEQVKPSELKYTPTCPRGYTDCVCDPAYIKINHPDWYKNLYGDKTPEEAASGCREKVREDPCEEYHCYDDEDK